MLAVAKRALVLGVVTAAAALPTPAGAQATPSSSVSVVSPGVVHLRGGTVLRGEVSESSATVRVRLSNGEAFEVPRSEVERLERDTPCPTSYVPTPSGRASSRTVHVHVESPEPVELEWRVHDEWKTACTSPCDVALPKNGRYRIAGDGIRPSREVSLEDGGACAELSVAPSASLFHMPGVVLTSVGGTLLGVGGLLEMIDAIAAEQGGGRFTPGLTGFSIMAAGAVLLPVGIAMLVTSRRTRVVVAGRERLASDAARSPGFQLPTWREAAADERALPRPQTVPIFQTTF